MSMVAQPAQARWRAYVRLGRISNLPTVWTNGLAGMILAGARDPSVDTLAIVAASLSLFYMAGTFLNDVFDHEFDWRYRSDRPIPAGAVSLQEVAIAGTVMLVTAEVILVLATLRGSGSPVEVMLGGLALAAAIVSYDWAHKRYPRSIALMALCRGTTYWIGGAVAATALSPLVLGGAAALFCYVLGLTYAAREEHLGRIGSAWPLLLLAVPLGCTFPLVGNPPFGTVLYLGFLGWLAYSLLPLLGRPRSDVPQGVGRLIAGISLVDAALIAAWGDNQLWAVVAVAGWVLARGLQRLVPGT